MPYSNCCEAFSYMPEIDICPDCREHCEWVYDADIEEAHIDKDDESVHSSQVEEELCCKNCEHIRGAVELQLDYCSHFKFQHMHPIIHNPDTVLADCPLK